MELNICIISVFKEYNLNNGKGFSLFFFFCLEKNF